MIKALLDTNILIDYMVPDRPGSSCALRIVEAAGKGRYEAVVSAGSLKDSYYIVRKHFDDDLVRGYLSAFMDLAEVVPIDRAACTLALASDEPDFEDGLVRVAAENAGADFIVTRDAVAFAASSARPVEPSLFADMMCGPQSCACR
ncbi:MULTISPECIES: PIN domain-containing protein [unclassified Adlercreutzia]|uniref:PIN domain-containing protein n=1 Tax=unclassified Adlercreutzia TaxID=2636013 RepID=UPI0013EC12E3|nr:MULTISPECIES: PIN domain-containing protein [unclassified Adlercreutzia]